MSVLRKLASQTAIYGLSSIIGRVAAWALTPIYTDKMAVGEYGVFSDIYAFTTYFLVILTFGMETAFFRYSGEDKTETKPYAQSFLFVMGMAVIFAVAFGFGHQSLANVLGYHDRPNLILQMVFITFFDVVVALPMAKLRFDERPIAFAVVSLVSIFFNIALNLIFILGFDKTSAEWVFFANLLASLFKLLLLMFVASPLSAYLKGIGRIGEKLAGIRLLPNSFKIDPVLLQSMAGFGLYIMVAGLLGMINQNSDVNFLQRLWGDTPRPFDGHMYDGSEMVGIYSANKKLAVLILLVTQAFRYAAEPFFFRHAQEGKSRAVFAKVFHYFALASLVVFLLVSSFSYEIVSFKLFGFQLVGEAYWGGLDVVPPLLFSFVIWGAYSNLTIWYKLTKQVRFGLFFSLIGVLIMVGLNLLLIPRYAYLGATWAMIISYVVMTLLVYAVGQRYYRIPYRMVRILFYTLLFVGAYLINAEMDGDVRGSAFGGKFFLSLACIGAVVLMERFLPIRWEPPKPAPAAESPAQS
jgi:O-antigen/teichoic acid export membrane protein